MVLSSKALYYWLISLNRNFVHKLWNKGSYDVSVGDKVLVEKSRGRYIWFAFHFYLILCWYSMH